MVVVVAYDVSTESSHGRKRLRRIAQACKNYGQRVQKSLFECVLRESDWVKLRHNLLAEMNQMEDSLRFYFLDETSRNQTEHHGVKEPIDLQGTLII